MADEVSGQASAELSLEGILEELNAEYTGELPERAIRAAQRRSEEITPHLIAMIREATELARDGEDVPEGGHFFALFLLTEFQVREALPAILDAICLSGEGPFEMFGDAVTEDLGRVLAELAPVETIDELVGARSVNFYVRWKAAATFLYLVRDGRLTRDEAVRRLHGHLREAVIEADVEQISALISELVDYAPHEAIADIEDAYRRNLVDSFIIDLPFVKRSVAEGERRIQRELERCPPTGIADTVAELRTWNAYREDDDSDFDSGRTFAAALSGDDFDDPALPEDMPPLPDEVPWESAKTIRNTGPKVGRNDPCPCGSGRKYKKCCGRG